MTKEENIAVKMEIKITHACFKNELTFSIFKLHRDSGKRGILAVPCRFYT